MALETSPFRMQYHFLVNDPVTLRAQFGLNPWKYANYNYYATYFALPHKILTNPPDETDTSKHLQLCRLGKNDLDYTGIFIYQYDRATPWLTYQSQLLHCEITDPNGLTTSRTDDPNVEVLFEAITRHGTCILPLACQDDKKDIFIADRSKAVKETTYENYLNLQNPNTDEEFAINVKMVESKLKKEPPRIIFSTPPVTWDMLDIEDETLITPDAIAQKYLSLEQKNFNGMLEFIDCMYDAKAIAPMTELPSVHAARIFDGFLTLD